ncbi:hypothetical protein BH09SUM1_BH09SUM1_18350 [soil metagenome]
MKEYLHFLCIARGSTAELQTQLLLAQRFKYITEEECRECVAMVLSVRRQLNALIAALKKNA